MKLSLQFHPRGRFKLTWKHLFNLASKDQVHLSLWRTTKNRESTIWNLVAGIQFNNHKHWHRHVTGKLIREFYFLQAVFLNRQME